MAWKLPFLEKADSFFSEPSSVIQSAWIGQKTL